MIGYVVLGTNDLPRDTVDRVHQKALEPGGADEGPPGPRAEGREGFYAGYFRDLDGRRANSNRLPYSTRTPPSRNREPPCGAGRDNMNTNAQRPLREHAQRPSLVGAGCPRA
jgi:hypothetical protein